MAIINRRIDISLGSDGKIHRVRLDGQDVAQHCVYVQQPLGPVVIPGVNGNSDQLVAHIDGDGNHKAITVEQLCIYGEYDRGPDKRWSTGVSPPSPSPTP